MELKRRFFRRRAQRRFQFLVEIGSRPRQVCEGTSVDGEDIYVVNDPLATIGRLTDPVADKLVLPGDHLIDVSLRVDLRCEPLVANPNAAPIKIHLEATEVLDQ